MEPRFDGPPSVIVQPQGNVLLECICSGNPQPTVTWYHKGEEISKGEKYQMAVRKMVGKYAVTLKIQNATQMDQGVYKAVARNDRGEHSTEQQYVAIMTATEVYKL